MCWEGNLVECPHESQAEELLSPILASDVHCCALLTMGQSCLRIPYIGSRALELLSTPLQR